VVQRWALPAKVLRQIRLALKFAFQATPPKIARGGVDIYCFLVGYTTAIF
jgi:hypothetical protein